MLSIWLIVLTIGGKVLEDRLLILLSVPGLVYLSIPLFKCGYRDLFEQRKIGAGVLDSTISVVMLLLQYFFPSALFFTLYYISRKILLKTEDSSRKSLIDVWGEVPKFACVEKEGVETKVPFDRLEIGDIVVIHAGEIIPVDGIVEKGMGNVDQHILTGEAQPTEKIPGDNIFASTLLLSGKLHVKVNTAGTETVAAKIKDILNNTTDYKTSLQARGEKIAEQSAMPTLVLGGITWSILGAQSAAAILLSSFGTQMRIVAPISILNFLKIASDRNILVKDGRALETLHKIDTVVFDKTGTLTQEKPHVEAIHTFNTETKEELLLYAAAAEYKQTHPIAKAILQEAENHNLELPAIDESNYKVGYGLTVKLDDKLIRVGSIRYMTSENIMIPPGVERLQSVSHEQGSSLVYVAIDERMSGAIELQATIRPEAKQVIGNLHERNKKIAIISGDREEPTQQLARQLGIDRYFAETLPENKAQLIEQLQEEGRVVCFVGDGINDSIALKKANVSISLQGASTIATDTAQIILMDESLQQLPFLFDLANRLENNLRTGFIASLLPGVMCVFGVYFLQIDVIASAILYDVCLTINVFNAMLPKLKRERN